MVASTSSAVTFREVAQRIEAGEVDAVALGLNVTVNSLGNVTYIHVYSDNADLARREAIRLAHEIVFSDRARRGASVDTCLVGRHGGAYVTGACATVRFHSTT